MNPYLEQECIWHDFHTRLIVAIAESLTKSLRPNYFTRIDHRLYARLASDDARPPEVDIERIRFVEIHDRRDRRVVTQIEVVSPTNKYSGPNRKQYLEERAAILRGQIHFVEIDLLRGGPRMPMGELRKCDYCVMVSRADSRPKACVWPIQLRDRLPKINIPLRSDDPDAELDLQEVLSRVYDTAFYESYLYEGVLYPELTAANAAWATELLRSKSRSES